MLDNRYSENNKSEYIDGGRACLSLIFKSQKRYFLMKTAWFGKSTVSRVHQRISIKIYVYVGTIIQNEP